MGMSSAEIRPEGRPEGRKDPGPEAQTIAAVDIGSNAIRMVVAEVMADGGVEALEQLQQGIHLGQDSFRRGRLGGQTMRAAVGILREYRRILDTYRVHHLRAVATSAVREAANADTFLDRALMSTGLEIEVIDTSEESRLTVAAVRRQLGGEAGSKRGFVLVAHVGGGSTLLTVVDRGEILDSHSLPLGSIRLREGLLSGGEPAQRAASLIRQQISNVLSSIQSGLPLDRIQTFVAIGGDARFAARQMAKATVPEGGMIPVARVQLDKLLRQCERHTTEELARKFALPFPDAETLNPALLVYQALLEATGVTQFLVSPGSMRDGLLLDLAGRVMGREDEALTKGVIRSALSVARKYHVDRRHAQNVADLSAKLFDLLQAEHGLAPRHRLLLRAAGLLHEVGGFVSNRSHHKHSYYLIANAEIFGLSRDEHLLAAHVARYHRRAIPQPTHIEYEALPRDRRILVNKLAALLRVADALDRAHGQQVRDFQGERQGEEFVITVPGVSDLTLERRAMTQKADLFEDVFGLRIRLEEARPAAVAAAG
jgi:exopolyphosphatase/guanosine-5'-triphosphate,3'-diphosphate pyrophosphatase